MSKLNFLKAVIISSTVAHFVATSAIAQGIDDDLWKTNSPWLSRDAIQFAAASAANWMASRSNAVLTGTGSVGLPFILISFLQ